MFHNGHQGLLEARMSPPPIIRALEIRMHLVGLLNKLEEVLLNYTYTHESELRSRMRILIRGLDEQIAIKDQELSGCQNLRSVFVEGDGITANRRYLGMRKVFFLFDELEKSLDGGEEAKIAKNYAKATELFNKLLEKYGKLPDALEAKLNRKWEVIRKRKTEYPLLSTLAEEIFSSSYCATSPLQSMIFVGDTQIPLDWFYVKCNDLENSLKKDLKTKGELDQKIFQVFYELKELVAILTENNKLEYKERWRELNFEMLLWEFSRLAEILNEWQDPSKRSRALIHKAGRLADEGIKHYAKLLNEYRDLPYNLYQQLVEKWQVVRSYWAELPSLLQLRRLVHLSAFQLPKLPLPNLSDIVSILQEIDYDDPIIPQAVYDSPLRHLQRFSIVKSACDFIDLIIDDPPLSISSIPYATEARILGGCLGPNAQSIRQWYATKFEVMGANLHVDDVTTRQEKKEILGFYQLAQPADWEKLRFIMTICWIELRLNE